MKFTGSSFPIASRLLAAGVVLLALSIPAWGRAEELGLPELREGSWIYRGPKSIVGRGGDEILTLRRGASGWTIERTYVRHPSVNDHQAPTYTRSGPQPIRRSDQLLLEENPEGKPTRRTLRWEDERLVYPAVVRIDPRTWRFISPKTEWEFRCKQNPMETPLGEAELQEGQRPILTGTYLYELLPRGATDNPNALPPPAQLRFLTRRGNVFGERFSLRWVRWGEPSYYQEGQSFDRDSEVPYELITPEALEMLLAKVTEQPKSAPAPR